MSKNITPQLIEKIRLARAAEPGKLGRRRVAETFGLSIPEARCVLRTLGVKDKQKSPKKAIATVLAPTLEQDLAAANLAYKNREANTAIARYRELLEKTAEDNEIIETFRETIQTAFSRGQFNVVIPPPAAPRARSSRTAEEAVLVISDSHVGKIFELQHTLGFGEYNPKIYLDRAWFLQNTVTRLLQENVGNPVQKLHVLFDGDLVEGLLNHAQEVPNRQLVADQVLLAATVFYQFVVGLSRVVPSVVVRAQAGGNHGRWGTQKKVPTENRYSNYDFLVMGFIQQLVEASGPSNIKVELTEGAFDVFDIFDWRFKVGHGDHLKGGDKALGVPAHSIGREINATTQRYNSIGQKAPDYYIVGDKHRYVGVATATGRYLINGAWFTDDEYAMVSNFSPCRPFQLFFGVHPKHGKSWSYDLNLHNAPSLKGVPYALPQRLLNKLGRFI